jgi:glutamine amidotransferase
MISILDYGMGNVGSIRNMVAKVGFEAEIISEPDAVARATKLVLPGVGAFDNAMKRLKQLDLIPILHERVTVNRVPILGLCLGMHLFCERSEEGELPGLGWIEADVQRFDFESAGSPLPIPHMGWNRVDVVGRHPSILDGQPDNSRFYFVHSYAVRCRSEADVIGTSEYGYRFHSAVQKDNVIGLQFHPEKSHRFGKQVLQRFGEL